MITFKHKGNLSKTHKFLSHALKPNFLAILQKYGEIGVRELRNYTPVDTGKTADSWTYEIVDRGNSISIYWSNTNINDGVPIAVILQYGHGTGNGGYVKGFDYINPAIAPVFEQIASEAWREVINQ